MLRLIMPQAEVLPLVAESFGSESEIYGFLEELSSGHPESPIDEVTLMKDFLQYYGELFYGESPSPSA
jgi:hypothetical protein